VLTNHNASSLAALGPVAECHGVQLRAQLRSVATVVQVTGHLSPANREQVSRHLRRFAVVGGALVLDLLGAGGVDDEFLRGLSPIANLTLVLDPARRDGLASLDSAAVVVGSVGEAMRGITERITDRRVLLVRSVSRH
jgi:hypothetical protein